MEYGGSIRGKKIRSIKNYVSAVWRERLKLSSGDQPLQSFNVRNFLIPSAAWITDAPPVFSFITYQQNVQNFVPRVGGGF